MGFLSDLFDPGRDDRRDAANVAEQAQVQGGSFRGPFGLRGRAGFTNNGANALLTSSLGDFNPVASRLLSSAQQNIGGGGALDLSFLGPLFQQSQGDLSNPQLDRTSNAGNFNDLGGLFQSALGVAGANPFDLGADTTQALRERALPENQRTTNSALSRLFSQGRLGTTGGANQIGRLAEAQNQQDLGFQLAGLEQVRGLQSDALQRLTTAFGGREAIAGRNFGENLAEAQLGGQFAQQRFGQGTSLASTLLQNLVQGQNIGLSSLQGATGLAQLPLAFQNAALNADISRSNAQLGRAGILQGNAQLARSPLLEGINAIGQFFQPIKLGGS